MKKIAAWLSALSISSSLISTCLVSATIATAQSPSRQQRSDRERLEVIPTLLGDGFFSFSGPISTSRSVDRLMVFANDLDAPNPLPSSDSVITSSEPGPLGVFSLSAPSILDIQQAFRNGQPLPSFTSAGLIPDAATLTTIGTLAEVQTQLAGSPEGYDIIELAAPPNGYASGVHAIFLVRNGGIAGQTVYDSARSGALLQGGDDFLDQGDDIDAFYFFDYVIGVRVESPFAATVRSGTVKFANGGRVLPQSRVFFDHGMYTDVRFVNGGQVVHRFVPGIERAFFDGLASVEVRLPFAATASSVASSSVSGIAADDDVQFGNVTMFSKVLLHRSDSFALSGGIGVSLPTARDITWIEGNSKLLEIRNSTVHLGPYFGFAYAPTDRCFAQGVMQTMFAANGNPVFADTGAGLAEIGVLNDASYLFTSLALGYWAFEPAKYERPLALLAELHHSTNISDNDLVQSGNVVIGQANNSVDFVNLTVGASMQLNRATNASVGFISPLTNDDTPGGGMQARIEYRP